MSDQHFKGGHELEGLNTRLLFQLFVGLSLVTFLSAVAVVQWFYRQRNDLLWERAAEGSFLLKQHRSEVGGLLEDIDATKEAVLGDPKLLTARKPPAGWVHPDDVKGAAPAAGAAEEHGTAPAEGHGAAEGHGPEGGAAEGAAHAEGVKAEGEKAEGEKAEDEAEGEKAEDEKAEDEKAEGEKDEGEKASKKPATGGKPMPEQPEAMEEP